MNSLNRDHDPDETGMARSLARIAQIEDGGFLEVEAMLAAGVLLRLWKQRGKPVARDKRIVDGEFRVVGKTVLPSA